MSARTSMGVRPETAPFADVRSLHHVGPADDGSITLGALGDCYCFRLTKSELRHLRDGIDRFFGEDSRSIGARVEALENSVAALKREEIARPDPVEDEAANQPEEDLPKGAARLIRDALLVAGSDREGLTRLIIRDGSGYRRDYLLLDSHLSGLAVQITTVTDGRILPVEPDDALTLAKARVANLEADRLQLLLDTERGEGSLDRVARGDCLSVNLDRAGEPSARVVFEGTDEINGGRLSIPVAPDMISWLVDHLIGLRRLNEAMAR